MLKKVVEMVCFENLRINVIVFLQIAVLLLATVEVNSYS